MNCHLLYVPRLSFQPASNLGGLLFHFYWLELAWQNIGMTRNNLCIFSITLLQPCKLVKKGENGDSFSFAVKFGLMKTFYLFLLIKCNFLHWQFFYCYKMIQTFVSFSLHSLSDSTCDSSNGLSTLKDDFCKISPQQECLLHVQNWSQNWIKSTIAILKM